MTSYLIESEFYLKNSREPHFDTLTGSQITEVIHVGAHKLLCPI